MWATWCKVLRWTYYNESQNILGKEFLFTANSNHRNSGDDDTCRIPNHVTFNNDHLPSVVPMGWGSSRRKKRTSSRWMPHWSKMSWSLSPSPMRRSERQIYENAVNNNYQVNIDEKNTNKLDVLMAWQLWITLTPHMVLPLFATRFAAYAGGIRVSFIQPCLF